MNRGNSQQLLGAIIYRSGERLGKRLMKETNLVFLQSSTPRGR